MSENESRVRRPNLIEGRESAHSSPQVGAMALRARWPELFDGLSQTQRRAVDQAFAAAWHEGWEPNRADVQDLTDFARDATSHDEYLRRIFSRATDSAGRWPNGSADRP